MSLMLPTFSEDPLDGVSRASISCLDGDRKSACSARAGDLKSDSALDGDLKSASALDGDLKSASALDGDLSQLDLGVSRGLGLGLREV
jgi:hypothetical protein